MPTLWWKPVMPGAVANAKLPRLIIGKTTAPAAAAQRSMLRLVSPESRIEGPRNPFGNVGQVAAAVGIRAGEDPPRRLIEQVQEQGSGGCDCRKHDEKADVADAAPQSA